VKKDFHDTLGKDTLCEMWIFWLKTELNGENS
jgi:hypothetical protein